jgi:anti-anti-sigma factor
MPQEPLVHFEEHPPITVGVILSTSVLDALNVTQFGNQVLAYIQGRHAVKLLLSFERVNYLSSAVLTELLRINEAVQEHQGHLRLCALNSDIRKVFEITNLDRIFVIYGAPDEAEERFRRSLQIEKEEATWEHYSGAE